MPPPPFQFLRDDLFRHRFRRLRSLLPAMLRLHPLAGDLHCPERFARAA